jgi:ribonuclease-3
MPASIEQLESLIGYSFRDIQLLERALTHRSFSGEHSYATDNERLEFLGDAILELIVSETLMKQFPDYAEGRLTKIRAHLVSAENLYAIAISLHLGNNLRLGKAEENSGGREKKALLADSLEALIAAVYVDSNYDAARSMVDRLIASSDQVAEADATLADHNPKSTLQELLQEHKLPAASYRVISEEGPPHQLIFRVELTIGELSQTTGTGSSKKVAEQQAAAEALADINEWMPK